MTLNWCAKTSSFRAVFGLPVRSLTLLLSALYNVMRKFFFIYVHIYILGAKLLPWNFLQISQLSIRSGAHKLLRLFLDFSQFLTAVARKLWRHLCIWQNHPFWKKALNIASKSTHKPSHMSPRAGRPSVTYKKHQFSLLQPARVVRSPQTLHADRERRSWQL